MNLRITASDDDEPTSPIRHPSSDLHSISSIGPSAGGVTGTAAGIQAPQTVAGVGHVRNTVRRPESNRTMVGLEI
jgi:hypothetical protein